ncbi:gliding motility-associated C-terminal domain-containing protein [Fluviicola sp.]|jgi:gliding motility-associated-like protein|uniref:T9SS type B sorting domain-containing protein n=1 Tax=Fluviicola sp. TaxID=1917219 RepID=UPI00283182BC|nr:gliding motility-associated C-terminal domain-containing protein [Fluviicola sp.]MDR0802750.1 gliding motility-associated C-terminal domain-containing protein [Fluviicola sp.]
MRLFSVLVSFFIIFSSRSYSQQLIINEVSQGTGSAEYVELLVIGNPSCQTPAPCMDLRGIVLDDNSGYFASGSGTGIAQGAVRFANNAFWSCIPQGTMIVVYNESDRNSAIPPDDLSMSDGNCRLIIPVNSTLFEGQSISPASSNNSYPASANWLAGAGSWSQVAMANTGDSFLILPGISSPTPSHAISYGNNTNNTIIYFSGGASGKVFSMTNNMGNDPFLQANWTSGNVGTNETPGAANNTANSAWIASMNPQCGIASVLQATATATPASCGSTCSGTANVTITGGTTPYSIHWSNAATTATISSLCPATYTVQVTDAGGCSVSAQAIVANGALVSVTTTPVNETCQGTCNGSITTTVTGGMAPYIYSWSNTATTDSISNLCPATYTVQVTDQNGCTGAGSGTISAGAAIQDPTIQTTGPFSTSDTPVQFIAASDGGTWNADCGTCISTSGMFNPQTAGAGTYQVCYSTGAGACTSQDCQAIVVTGCTPQTTSESHSICPGSSYTFNSQTFTIAGSYPFHFTGQNGCDSTHTLNLSFYMVTPTSQSITRCAGDSAEVQGTWYYTSDNVVTNITDANGCPTTHSTNIVFEDCSIEDYAVFIPNIFTPNNDNINDFFAISIMGGFLEEGFIVNRWGNIIKEFYSDELTWDGKTREGFPVSDGVYTYVLVISNTVGTKTKYNGFVTVVR